jgi:hypothetical protein
MGLRSRAPSRRSFVQLEIEPLEDRLAPAGFYATGAAAGGGPEVHLYDADSGTLQASFYPWPVTFSGGVRVAMGNLDGDGSPDLVVAAGPGGLPEVKVYDGTTLSLLRDFFAFPLSFRGGVNVALGDVNGDGQQDIICGADAGGAPQVTVFDGQTGAILRSFYAFPVSFTGGVHVASVDSNQDGYADIVCGAGAGALPQVAVYSGKDGSLLNSFYALPTSFSGGLSVAAADLTRQGETDIIVGAGAGGAPQVSVYQGVDASLVNSFYAFDPSFRGGVHVDAGQVLGQSNIDILVGAGLGGQPELEAFDPVTYQVQVNFDAYSANFEGGVYVAGFATGWKGGLPPTELPPLGPQVDPITRLGLFQGGSFVPVQPGSVTGGDVYVVTHGWAPGLLDWVQQEEARLGPNRIPLWWWTYQPLLGDPITPPFVESSWMFEASQTDTTTNHNGDTVPAFTISPQSMAEQILTVDPKATILAYSWVDESATIGYNSVGFPINGYASEGLTFQAGLDLAVGLHEALASTFTTNSGAVHLIGHSHGSRVVSVAALALQEIAVASKTTSPVKQVTILDSPEDYGTYRDDVANFNWFFLSQLQLGRDPLNTPGTLFVDNYISEFGDIYDNIGLTNAPVTTTNTLNQVVDVNLLAWPFNPSDFAGIHEYAPTWYAGTATSITPLGLAWSPFIGGPATNVPTSQEQTWTNSNYGPTNQFAALTVLQQKPAPPTLQATFTPITITNSSNQSQVSSVPLTETGGQDTFVGTFKIDKTVAGFSFGFNVSQAGAGDVLQIYVNSNQLPSFQVNLSSATAVAGASTEYATIGLGYEAPVVYGTNTVTLTMVLRSPSTNSTKQAQVTVNSFDTFTQPT